MRDARRLREIVEDEVEAYDVVAWQAGYRGATEIEADWDVLLHRILAAVRVCRECEGRARSCSGCMNTGYELEG